VVGRVSCFALKQTFNCTFFLPASIYRALAANMVRQSVLVVVAFLAVSVFAEPFRRRRQSDDSSVVPCPVRCNWQFSNAWSKAVSFQTPTENMGTDTVDGNMDTFSIMCGVFKSYRECLDVCPTTNETHAAAVKATPSFDQVCVEKRSEFDHTLLCLSNNTKLYQSACRDDGEKLRASSARMTSPIDSTNPAYINEYCSTASQQLYCVLPIVRQTCGEAPDNYIRSIAYAILIATRDTIGEDVIKSSYPECTKYFDIAAHGVPTPISNDISTTTFNDTTPSTLLDNSNSTGNSSDVILRDDPIGETYVPGGPDRFGGSVSPRFTTPSGAPKVNFNNLLAFFTFSILFVFSCH